MTPSAPVSLRMRKDLLRRQDTRNELQEKLRFSLVCMGKERGDDPRQYVLDDAAIANLDSLTERFSNLQIRLATAKAELQKADRAAKEYDETPEIAASVNLAAENLESVVIEIRAADLTSVQKTASANLENARANVAGAAAALKPWNRTSIEILSQNPPTDDQAERWRDAAKRLDQEILSIGEQRKRNDREIKQIQTRIDNLTQLEGLITDEQANSLRGARDQAWQVHYMRLDRETADAFKAAMDEDDRVRELRSEQSDRIGELRSIQMQLKERTATGDSLSTDEFRCDEERKNLGSETAPVFASLGLPADFSPLDLPEWLKKRSQAEKSIIEFQKQERELIRINSELDSQRAELLAALARAGVSEIDKGAALKKLLAIAADAANKAKNARDRLEQREKQRLAAKENLEDRRSALAEIELELVQWNLSWKDACKNSWLQGMKSQSVKALLNELRNLRENLSKLQEIDHRIAGMEHEIENFVRQVRSLADELGMSSDADPFALFDEIRERVEAAQNAQREFEQNRKDQDRELSEIRRTTDELSTIGKRVSEIAGVFSDEESIVSAKDLLLALRKCDERSAVMAEIGKCERRLVNLLETETAHEAVALVESKKEVLESEILACKAEAGAAGEEFVRRVRDSAEAQNRIEAIGSDEKAAALAQDRQTLLVEIRETAKKALRSRLGVFAARRALQKYREAHRNELLEYATKFFSEMTLGNYSRLDADGSAAEDILIARRESDNRSCQVHELSKGTQFQLYLALRLAGFRRFCQGNSPLPFVADDIMASFDDERAEQAFRIMLDISRSSQMIYLTHHEHMVEIAVRAGGSRVRQHRLPVSSRSE